MIFIKLKDKDMKQFMTQNIKLIKKDGKELDNITSSVQEDKIYMDQKIPVENSDYFIYQNSLGIEEKLVVDNVHVYDIRGVFHHIEISYHKDIK